MIEDPRAWLEENAERLSTIVAAVGRRRRIPKQEQDDLLSALGTHVVKNDYRVLRAFRGTHGIVPYLTAVADRLFLDMRTSQWGKWRPSTRARRLGKRAVMLERLVLRDGQPLDAATDTLSAGQDEAFPLDLTAQIATRAGLPKRRLVEMKELRSDPAVSVDPFTTLLDKHHARRGAYIGRRLEVILRQLSAADQVLVRMRHEQGLRVSQIAGMLRVDQNKLYRRLYAIYSDIGTALLRDGISADEASVLTSGPVAHLPRVLKSVGRNM